MLNHKNKGITNKKDSDGSDGNGRAAVHMMLTVTVLLDKRPKVLNSNHHSMTNVTAAIGIHALRRPKTGLVRSCSGPRRRKVYRYCLELEIRKSRQRLGRKCKRNASAN